MNGLSQLERRTLLPKKDITAENVDTFVCQTVVHQNCGVLTNIFTIPRGKLLYNISLHPQIQFVYIDTTLRASELCDMDWAILISGYRLEHIKIMPSQKSQRIHIDRKLRVNNLLQMQIDLTNVILVSPPESPPNPVAGVNFMIRVEGILVSDRGGSGVYPQ